MVNDTPADITANIPNENVDDTSLDPGKMSDLNRWAVSTAPSTVSIPARPELQSIKVKTLVDKNRRLNGAKPNGAASEQRQRSFNVDSRQPLERYTSRVRSETEVPREFGNRIILYRKYEISRDSTGNIQKTKKRSLIAKAMPILKKPWDLIKAIGSKLN